MYCRLVADCIAGLEGSVIKVVQENKKSHRKDGFFIA